MKKIILYLAIAMLVLPITACSSTKEKQIVCKTPKNYDGEDTHQNQFTLTYKVDEKTKELKSFTIVNNIDDKLQTLWENLDRPDGSVYNREDSFKQAKVMNKQFEEQYGKYDFIDYKQEEDAKTMSLKSTLTVDLSTDFDYMNEANKDLSSSTGYAFFYNNENKKFYYDEKIVKKLYSAVSSLECN